MLKFEIVKTKPITQKTKGKRTMKNYIKINNQKIELTDEQVSEIQKSFGISSIKLSDIPVGETFKIGEYEFFVLDRLFNSSIVGLKDTLADGKEFGKNNNYKGSYVDDICNNFADKIAGIIGKENLHTFEVDLTSDDGLKDYGSVDRKMFLLTANLYRKYVEILDKQKLDKYWWLSTPHSTPTHSNGNWVKCVSPSGSISNTSYDYDSGVRPFCILNSNIFVSK